MALKVQFVETTSADFNSYAQKDEGTLYFLSDTKEIYRGNQRYSIGKDSVASVIGTVSVNPMEITNVSQYNTGDIVIYSNYPYLFDGEKFIQFSFQTDWTDYINELLEDSDEKRSQIIALNQIANNLKNRVIVLEGYHTASDDDIGTEEDKIIIQDGQMYWGRNIVDVTDGIKFSHM